MNEATLFAWAAPAYYSESPVDHTWVTDYDNRQTSYEDIQLVISANQNYWFCWGAFHPKGEFLGNQVGDLTRAKCLVQSNADSGDVEAARGTIFIYGIDGVCHQLANQVLYATKGSQTAPLTVRSARGYFASTYLYSTYGRDQQAWVSKVASCYAERALAMTELPDDFEEHARSVLESKDPQLLKGLLELREHSQRSLREKLKGTVPSAEDLNKRNQEMLDEAAKLLGRDNFIQVFGFPREQRTNLVDPSLKSPKK